eukprot:m.199553 g.199553  ORF g.199553 m.199553 type:complete len:60 (+) comp17684_c0_seq2:1530-1709(+)
MMLLLALVHDVVHYHLEEALLYDSRSDSGSDGPGLIAAADRCEEWSSTLATDERADFSV